MPLTLLLLPKRVNIDFTAKTEKQIDSMRSRQRGKLKAEQNKWKLQEQQHTTACLLATQATQKFKKRKKKYLQQSQQTAANSSGRQQTTFVMKIKN